MAKRLPMDDWPMEILWVASEAKPPVKIDAIWRVPELDDPDVDLPTYCVHSKFVEGGCDVEFTRIVDGEPIVPPEGTISSELYNLFAVACHSEHMQELNLEFRSNDA